MKEKTLLKLALICSVIGLVALFFIAEHISVEEVAIDDITASDVGKEVKIIGKIEKASNSEKILFLEVGQEKVETVTVVLFKEKDINLQEGDYVELIGEVSEYKGDINIIANAVKIR